MANVLASISTTLRLTTLLWAGATVFLLGADPASAQESRHARLSSDLAERLRVGDQREASVIITGTEAQVNELAPRTVVEKFFERPEGRKIEHYQRVAGPGDKPAKEIAAGSRRNLLEEEAVSEAQRRDVADLGVRRGEDRRLGR